jgi:signal peptidase I
VIAPAKGYATHAESHGYGIHGHPTPWIRYPWGLTLTALTAAVLAWMLRRRLAVVTVSGPSMQPAYASGDRVLVRRAGLSQLRPGAVVVVEQPGAGGRWTTPPPRWPASSREWMIKRVAALPGDTWPAEDQPAMRLPPGATGPASPVVPAGSFAVLGDNPAGSYDSRVFGYCPASRLLGVVTRTLRTGRRGTGGGAAAAGHRPAGRVCPRAGPARSPR